jgi:hypothetical protein
LRVVVGGRFTDASRCRVPGKRWNGRWQSKQLPSGPPANYEVKGRLTCSIED